MVPTSSQDEALARYGVSREVPCSVLKCETAPDTFPATPKISPTRRVSSRGTPRVPAPLHLSPFSLLITTGESIPLRCVEGVPGLPDAPHDEACFTRKFDTSHVGGAPCRTTPISRSALDKTRCPDISSKATLWVKAQHEGALTPPCIVRKHTQVPHTTRRGA